MYDESDFYPATPRWTGLVMALITTPLIAFLPIACNCLSRNSYLFKAYYIQGVGIGSIVLGVVLFAIILGVGDSCVSILSDCNASCHKSYPAGITIAVLLVVLGVASMWLARRQILRVMYGRF
ncbi:hypothetical protein HDU79_007902 [Rhizoclosmatium sp. JEL0117]|nr:hypothetical protein HDU99_003786 [Rhizoclosmatium hyalinum]KAJ3295936.1 hypothetical protein HDU79_007902 [Rhizoclosmatium sp. JEL0117]